VVVNNRQIYIAGMGAAAIKGSRKAEEKLSGLWFWFIAAVSGLQIINRTAATLLNNIL